MQTSPTPETDSVEKHNVFPERMFGFLDHILKYKPNISTLAAEAYVMFGTFEHHFSTLELLCLAKDH